jgi:hypothetical protein
MIVTVEPRGSLPVTMSRRSRMLFLFLVVAQLAHSVEEYLTRLFEVFAPARVVSALVHSDLAVGFVTINAVVVGVGIGCYAGPVRSGHEAGRLVAWLWVVIELVNGVAHIALAALARGYFSGAITAVVLVGTSACLAFSLRADSNRGAAPIAARL